MKGLLFFIFMCINVGLSIYTVDWIPNTLLIIHIFLLLVLNFIGNIAIAYFLTACRCGSSGCYDCSGGSY